jgi:TonB family protein
MFRPDDFDDPGPPAAPVAPSANPAGREISLREIASTLSAHGGGASSADVALDLVLNKIVEQARISSHASGAAIFLTRDGAMACRASAGTDAPDLGVRLNTDSGLSRACVQSRQWQSCEDSEGDARVDAEVCRRLGVRSIFVFPVVRLGSLHREELAGVIELFSPHPGAFGSATAEILRTFARQVVENLDIAAEAVFPAQAEEREEHDPEKVVAGDPELVPAITAKEPRRDYWTPTLNVVVITLALLLGWMVGRAGWKSAGSRHRPRTSAVQESQTPGTPSPDASQGNVSGSASSARPASLSGAGKSSAENAPPGGLIVSKGGRVVFRMAAPTETAEPGGVVNASGSATPPVEIAPAIADGYIASRVEPEYPAAAREQGLQGVAVLNAVVSKDGAVKELDAMSGDAILVAAASDAVRQWRFKPFFLNGQPAEFQTRITVTFRLP